jgi:ATP-dependent Lon protease
MPKRKEPKMDDYEYCELLSELYPSQYILDKKQRMENIQNIVYDDTYIQYIKEKVNYLCKYTTHKELTKLKKLNNLLNREPINKIEITIEIDKKINIINKLLKLQNDINMMVFNSYINSNNMSNNQTDYFKSLDIEKQQELLLKLSEIKKYDNNKPYLIQLLESNMPIQYKQIGLNKILQLNDKDNNEYYKLNKWVDLFLKLPFNKSSQLPITINDGIDKCREYMSNCETILNNCVYGMDNVKGQILQLIGKWITNPQSIGTAIGLKGPMGTGKTTLIKNGISKILNREFAFITLGGSVDGSTLKGHSYTYEGSAPGKIADILIQTKTDNPIIFFDELDKVSNKTEEIYSILTHLTDTTQNSQFHDNYFSEIDLDLSKCLFVFSFNDESLINPILRDRMYTIEVDGYTTSEKIIIAQKHLIPVIIKDIGLLENDIILSPAIIQYIIEITKKEDGVRNLKRSLEIIYSKLNLFRILKTTTIFESIIEVVFPFTVTRDIINKLIKVPVIEVNNNVSSMYI